MQKRTLYGILSIGLGIVLLCGSFYVTSQVEAGQKKLSTAEKLSRFGDQALSMVPGTEEYGKSATDSIEDKVREGEQQIAFYTAVAKGLKIGGILLLVLGGGLLFLKKKRG